MSRRHPLSRILCTAVCLLAAPVFAAFMTIMNVITAPVISPIAVLTRSQPRSIFETRRAGLA
jgi:hypothetical protein